ncbi:unnamed protein product, partial [Ectocarpus sp. 12 AP-2014]
MAAATGDRRRRKDVRPAGFLASPPLLLLSLLLASAPDSGGSFLYPTGRGGSCDDGGGATLTASRDHRGGGRYNFSRGRAGGGVVAIVVGGTATKTGGGGAGGSGGSGGLAGAKRGRGSSSMGMPSDERRGVLGAKAMSANQAEISVRRGSLTSLASKSVGMAAAAAAAAAGVPHDKAEGAGDGGPKHGDDRSVSVVEEGGVEERVPTAGELLVMARDLYDEIFGPPEDVRHVCAGYAPGRVNLIGEHTDYQGGFVLPLALERGTVVYGVGRLVDSDEATAEGSDRGLCRVVSQTMQQQQSEDEAGGKAGELGGDVSFRADESLAPGEPEWANYVKGVVKEYMPKVPEGKRLEFTVTVVRSVPIGGGVSSSASLSVAVATFLQGVLTSAGVTPPSPKEKAHLCRMAEHKFLNMPCGIMDQFVTSMAVPGHAMLLDCRSEEPDAVPLSDSNLVVVVTNSNVKHNLAGSQYPIRVAQCEAARDELQKSHPDVQLLRDATPEQVLCGDRIFALLSAAARMLLSQRDKSRDWRTEAWIQRLVPAYMYVRAACHPGRPSPFPRQLCTGAWVLRMVPLSLGSGVPYTTLFLSPFPSGELLVPMFTSTKNFKALLWCSQSEPATSVPHASGLADPRHSPRRHSRSTYKVDAMEAGVDDA